MFRFLVPLLFVFFLAPQAMAVEALSTAELVSHCDHYDENGHEADRIFCVRYIQGFIDGAVATDERVTRNVVEEYKKEETYSQRAARTRIGNRLNRYGASVYADFCLGHPVPLKEVVERVVANTRKENLVNNNPLARDLVYLTLRNHYPCPVED